MKICKFENCQQKHDSHGYCANHARQYRKYGHPLSVEEVALSRSRASSKRKPTLGKTWNIDPAKREAMKGVRKNTGRTHFTKGVPPWNKGTTGVMKAWNKGIKMTDKQKEILSGANKGRYPWNKIGDGITPQSKLERHKFRKTTQMLIFQRDDFTCQICEQRGGYLQVDHIKRWADYPELRFSQDNCRTVCMACHYYITFKRKLPEGVIWGHNLSRRIES